MSASGIRVAGTSSDASKSVVVAGLCRARARPRLRVAPVHLAEPAFAGIDRGGVLASLFGTWALRSGEGRALLKAVVINKFRGDVEVLELGLDDEDTRAVGPGAPGVGTRRGLMIETLADLLRRDVDRVIALLAMTRVASQEPIG